MFLCNVGIKIKLKSIKNIILKKLTTVCTALSAVLRLYYIIVLCYVIFVWSCYCILKINKHIKIKKAN